MSISLSKRYALNAKRYKRGFTLIETLIVLAIIGIIASLAVPFYYSFQKRSQLNSTLPEIVQTLRRAQSKAIDGDNDKKWGVHFETGKFVLFKGDSYVSDDETNEIFDLGNGLEIYNISLPGGDGSNVIFEKLNGQTENDGSVSVRVKDGSDSRTVSISPEGVVTWQ